MGAKQTRRKALSNYQYFNAQGKTLFVIIDAQLSNIFNYIQNVSAGYLLIRLI
ncbi:MAG: hypothetical protein IPJ20_08355 [Flammeovirgaceae bacterium]|nr:hypothetical protein [Flammeovirgaceae bacterium]